MKDYTYRPLKGPKAQIRLVRLLPLTTTPEQQGSHQLELRCTLKSACLRDNPEYTALSYTWGTQGRTSRLIVKDYKGDPANGETAILITPSLEAALLNFRQPTKCITLWIDQLCINQDDISEKDLQVPLMRTIYEKARDVLVWLGPTTDGSDHLLKILNEAGKQASQAGLLNGDKSKSELARAFEMSLSELLKPGSLGPRFTIPTESLRSFVARPWWTRVWVVQEISVASSVTFVCGHQRITYDHLRNALQFYAFYILNKAEKFQARHLIAKLFTIRTLLVLQKAPCDSAATQMLSSSYKYKCQKENTGGHGFLRILELSHVVKDSNHRLRLQATNDRDKIYGLLGLVKNADELGMQPQYEKELPAVFIEVASALLKTGQVDLLWFCQFPKSEGCLKLPSWVPDWTGYIQAPYGSNFSSTSSPFAASGGAQARIAHIGNEEGCINLQGVFVGDVDVLGRVWEDRPGSGTHRGELKKSRLFSRRGFHMKIVSPFIQELNLFFDDALSKGTALDPSVIEEARWRTPIGDKEWEDEVASARRATNQSREVHLEVCRRIEVQKSTAVLRKKQTQKRRFVLLRVLWFLLRFLGYLFWVLLRFLFKRLYRLVVMPQVPSEKDKSFVFPIDTGAGVSYMNFMQQMYGRRPFRTRNGYVGLGPAAMTEGDIVCIILGAQVPYVLRPQGKGRYQLTG